MRCQAPPVAQAMSARSSMFQRRSGAVRVMLSDAIVCHAVR